MTRLKVSFNGESYWFEQSSETPKLDELLQLWNEEMNRAGLPMKVSVATDAFNDVSPHELATALSGINLKLEVDTQPNTYKIVKKEPTPGIPK